MTNTYHVELVRWMMPVYPVNIPDQTFYMIGYLLDKPLTIVLTGDGGRTHFWCQRHNYAYPIQGSECEMCQIDPAPEPHDQPADASVTPRNAA